MVMLSFLCSIVLEWLMWKYIWNIRAEGLNRFSIGCETLLGERFSPCLFIAKIFKRLRRYLREFRKKEPSNAERVLTWLAGSEVGLTINVGTVAAAFGKLCLENGGPLAISMIPPSWTWKLLVTTFIINFVGLWFNTGNYQSYERLRADVNWRRNEMWWAINPNKGTCEERARHEHYASSAWIKTYLRTMIELEAQVPKQAPVRSRRQQKPRVTCKGTRNKLSTKQVRCAGCGKCLS